MLTGKQKQYLKSIAVNFPAVVQIGKNGIEESVIDSVSRVIKARELVKIKINQNSAEDINNIAVFLSKKLSCELVQIIGRNCILFKQKKEKSHYELP